MVREALEVSIIDAREEHVPFIAWVQLTAFRSQLPKGMWDFFVGGPEEDSLRFLEALATTQTRHWGSYQGFIIAEVEGTPAAAMTGYVDAESSLEEGIAEACQTLGMTQDDIIEGWKRAGTIQLVETKHAPGSWITENVATTPKFRRRGLVDKLLAEMTRPIQGRDHRRHWRVYWQRQRSARLRKSWVRGCRGEAPSRLRGSVQMPGRPAAPARTLT